MTVRMENLRNGQFLIHRTHGAGIAYTAARCYDEETATILFEALKAREQPVTENGEYTPVVVPPGVQFAPPPARRKTVHDAAVVAQAKRKVKRGRGITLTKRRGKK